MSPHHWALLFLLLLLHDCCQQFFVSASGDNAYVVVTNVTDAPANASLCSGNVSDSQSSSSSDSLCNFRSAVAYCVQLERNYSAQSECVIALPAMANITMDPRLGEVSIDTTIQTNLTELKIVIDGRGASLSALEIEETDPVDVSCVDVGVSMYDSYGDGWNGNYLYFAENDAQLPQLTLDDNNPNELSYKYEVVCLPAGTYTPFACGGFYPGEVSWEVHVNEVTGGATEVCAGPPTGADSFTVGVDSGYSSRLLYLRGGGGGEGGLSVTVQNVTIRHFGYSESTVWGGAVFATDLTKLKMHSVTFVSNHGGDGGALYVTSTTSITFLNCIFSNNIAYGNGGALYFDTLNNGIVIEDSEFHQNSATTGDGGAVVVRQSNHGLHMSNCSFSHSSASLGNGGSVYLNSDNHNAVLASIKFSFSTAYNGGGLYVGTENTHVRLLNSSFLQCRATYDGGSVFLYQWNDYMIFDDVIFSNSIAWDSGGGVYLFSLNDHVTMTNVQFHLCSGGSGGGVRLYSSNDYFYLSNGYFLGCESSDSGGSINFYENNDNAVIEATSFESSFADGWGGSLYMSTNNANIQIIDSTFAGSYTSNSGGAIAFTGDGNNNAALINVTFLNNGAGAPGGAIVLYADNEEFSCVQCSFKDSSGYYAVHIGQGCHFFVCDDCNFDAMYGAIFFSNAVENIEIRSSEFVNGYSVPAMYFENLIADVLIKDCTFAFNSNSFENGGALRFGDSSMRIVIENTLFTSNFVEENGGALSFESGNTDITIFECTFEDNFAAGNGGGIYGYDGNSYMRLVSSTFVGNYAQLDGGAGFFDKSHYYFTMQDTQSYLKSGHLESDHPYVSQAPVDDKPAVLESLFLCGHTEVAVSLCDSYGDGWDGIHLYFSTTDSTLATPTLTDGGLDCVTQIICLPAGTYTPFACGAWFADEVSWEVLGVSGGATEACSGPPPGAASITVERSGDNVGNNLLGYYLVFDQQTYVDDLETVTVYSHAGQGATVLYSNTGSTEWPGVDLPPLHLLTPSVYVEFTGPDYDYVLAEGNWGFKVTIVADMEREDAAPYSQQVTQNIAGESGGGFYFEYETVFPLFLHVNFEENYAISFQGGAAFFGVCNGGVVIDKSAFVQNWAHEGAAIYFFTYNYGLVLTATTFTLNLAESNGGALFFASGNGLGLFRDLNTIQLVECDISSNGAGGSSGGVHIFYENYVEFYSCNISKNIALLAGGAMDIIDKNSVELNDCSLLNNSAEEGGAMMSKSANTLSIYGGSFSHNVAELNGGALYLQNDTLLSFYGHTIFDGNSAGGMGGGVLLFGVPLWSLQGVDSSLVFRNCRASHGSALAMVALKQYFNTTESGKFEATIELHDISFENNIAVTAGTVYWFFDSGHEEGGHEPAGLSNLTWVNNRAPYGERYCTQPVFLDVNATYHVTLYNTAVEPGIVLYLTDFYHELAVSSNSSVAVLEISEQHCAPKFGFIQNGQTEVSVLGVFYFLGLEMTCYPEGNVTLRARALVSDIALLGLKPADFPAPSTKLDVTFRACEAGETIEDASCVQCPQGSYLLEFDSSLPGKPCTICPSEAEECFGNQIILKSDYWRRTDSSEAILECPLVDACVGGNATNELLCNEGNEGVLCAVCSNGYFLSTDSNSCLSCDGAAAWITPALLAAMLVLLVLVTLVCLKVYEVITTKQKEQRDEAERESQYEVTREHDDEKPQEEKEKELKKEDSEFSIWFNRRINSILSKMRILMSTFQIIMNSQGSFRISFPSSFNKFINVFAPLNLNLIDIIPVSCMMESDFIQSLIISTLAPFVFTCLLFICFVAELLYRRRRILFEATITRDRRKSFKLFRVQKQLSFRYVSIFLFMTYWVLPGVTTTIFKTFVCVDADPDNEDSLNDMYLESDLSLSCTSSWYTFGVIWACISILVYPVGVPLLYLKLLWSRREEIKGRHDATKNTLNDQVIKVKPEKTNTKLVNFLYESYRPQHWYFEIVETSRRLMLTAILSVIAAGSSLQIIVAILFSLFYLEVYGSIKPYNDVQNNFLSKMAMYQIYFTYLIALIIKKDLLGGSANNFLGVCLIAINMVNILLIIYFEVVAFVIERRRNKKRPNSELLDGSVEMRTLTKHKQKGQKDGENGEYGKQDDGEDEAVEAARQLVESRRRKLLLSQQRSRSKNYRPGKGGDAGAGSGSEVVNPLVAGQQV